MAENKDKTHAGRIRSFILVVDPDAESVFRLSVLLVRLHYDFITVASAEAALRQAAVQPVSAVITALDLPDMSGPEFLELIKRDPATASIPVFCVTRDDKPDIRSRCLRFGATGFLSDPIEAEILYSTLQSAVEQHPRAYIRIPTVQAVKVSGDTGESLRGAFSLAISEGGMLLRTMNPVSVSTKLSLQFNLVDRTISAEAEVLYDRPAGSDGEHGVGLRFTGLSMKDRQLIRDYVTTDIMKGITLERKSD